MKKIIENSKTKLIHKTIKESDIVVIDINTTSKSEAEVILNLLKDNFSVNTTIIILSNLMTWYNTPKMKDVEENQEEEQEGDKQEEEEKIEDISSVLKDLYGELNEINPDKAKEIIHNMKVTYRVKDLVQLKKKNMKVFTEEDFPLRTPYKGYEDIKLFETRCLNMSSKYNHLNFYVIACGVAYGNGEDIFFEWFKKAWLQDPKALNVLNDGLNHIPTIHVNDVAKLVRKVLITKPDKHYLIAVDKTNFSGSGNDKSKLFNLIKSISKNVGSGEIVLESADNKIKNDNRYQ